jgi:hypothetical protein
MRYKVQMIELVVDLGYFHRQWEYECTEMAIKFTGVDTTTKSTTSLHGPVSEELVRMQNNASISFHGVVVMK